VLPFDAYTLTDADIGELTTAQNLLTSRCMRERGLSWPIGTSVPGDRSPNRRRYGVVEMPVARAFGYHPPPVSTQRRSGDSDGADSTALSRKQRTAAYGAGGHGGCVAHASSAVLRGVPHADLSLLNRLDGRIWDASQHDPTVHAAFARWSACMRRQGYAFTDPITVNDDRRWQSKRASAAELATAVADVSCKQETTLVHTWHAAESSRQRQAVAHNATYFAGLKAAKQHLIANAHAIIKAERS